MRNLYSIIFVLCHLFISGQNVSYPPGNAGNAGDGNTSVGYNAGINTTGYSNSFFGFGAGLDNTTGFENTFIGNAAGSNNTVGFVNTYIGTGSALHNQEGSQNTFVGYISGMQNKGSFNTFIGSNAGQENISGQGNSYLGNFAGYYGKMGSWNTFLGTQSGSQNEGDNNVFIGSGTDVWGNASNNVLIGSNLSLSENQSNKLAIGFEIPLVYGDFVQKGVGINTTDLDGYTLAVGGKVNIEDDAIVDQSLTVNTGLFVKQSGYVADKLTIGTDKVSNRYTLHVFGDAYATGIWLGSDKRFKTNFKKINGALNKLIQIEGQSYEFQDDHLARRDLSTRDYGFVAQDLKKTFPDLVHEDEDGYLAVNYIGLIPVLTEAVKDLEIKLNAIDQYNSTLEEQNEKLLTWISNSNPDVRKKIISEYGFIGQSQPNPGKSEVSIEYQLPKNFQKARIYFFDLQGKEIRSIDLNKSFGTLKINAVDFPKGLYNYGLSVDGQILQVKKMLIKD